MIAPIIMPFVVPMHTSGSVGNVQPQELGYILLGVVLYFVWIGFIFRFGDEWNWDELTQLFIAVLLPFVLLALYLIF